MNNTSSSILSSIGFSSTDLKQLSLDQLVLTGNYPADIQSTSTGLLHALNMLAKLPTKVKRSELEKDAAKLILEIARQHRETFLARHVQTLYEAITQHYTQFVRMDQLVFEASKIVPGLTPSLETLAQEAELLQSQKDGHEIDQGIFLSHVLANQKCGMHLCHTMLLPHPQTVAYQEQ